MPGRAQQLPVVSSSEFFLPHQNYSALSFQYSCFRPQGLLCDQAESSSSLPYIQNKKLSPGNMHSFLQCTAPISLLSDVLLTFKQILDSLLLFFLLQITLNYFLPDFSENGEGRETGFRLVFKHTVLFIPSYCTKDWSSVILCCRECSHSMKTAVAMCEVVTLCWCLCTPHIPYPFICMTLVYGMHSESITCIHVHHLHFKDRYDLYPCLRGWREN